MLCCAAQSPDLLKTYMEELKGSRIPYKDSPELIQLILEFTISNPTFFDIWKVKFAFLVSLYIVAQLLFWILKFWGFLLSADFMPFSIHVKYCFASVAQKIFLDMYVKAVLNAREKPTDGLSEAFAPLFADLSHEDFKNIVLPSSVKMLKRNPELVLESIGVLLKTVKIDLSKYAVEILSVVLTQARHADEGRRFAAFAIVRCLSQKSSSPDAVEGMFNAIKSVIGG